MKNYEWIKNMSVEEMANKLLKMCENMDFCDKCPLVYNCPTSETEQSFINWLENEVTK